LLVDIAAKPCHVVRLASHQADQLDDFLSDLSPGGCITQTCMADTHADMPASQMQPVGLGTGSLISSVVKIHPLRLATKQIEAYCYVALP